MWAGDVTPEQALKQAQNFVQNQVTAGRRAPGATPQLALKGTVSGLYVFNVADDEGFVIVSNDDRTTPVLGYSTSGSIDPDNMPANMRAWLQGYADEIAWMNKHNIQRAPQSANRRTGSSVKKAIDPLVKTKWDQGAPYNNMTPYYKKSGNNYYYSASYQEGYKHCATGCVATAMAQVMKYHEWPKNPTASIPEYQWNNIWLPAEETPLASTTFDWANMQNTYSGEYTEAQATAIATLMQYCGYSVEMDYGPESGSNTKNVADALKDYFNYNETTQFVSRSFYSYADWIELIYHELSQERPVVYGGSSSGGGHEFVCDGYQGEDYFHINWGWGGTSDNYFKLSALDPHEQGIGGSSSTDGYHYGQDAVIGIQTSEGKGTVLDVTSTAPNLTLNSITVRPQSVTLGETVTVTLNVTNNNTKAYDGDLLIYAGSIGFLGGGTFVIQPNETKDCNISYTPSGFTGTINIKALRPNAVGSNSYLDSNKSAQLTVNSATATNNVELTLTVDVDNQEATGHSTTSSIPVYNLYGNVLKGTATLTNNTETDYTGQFWWLLNPNGEDATVHKIAVSVPKGTSKEIKFVEDNLDYTKDYILSACYIKNNTYSWSRFGYYQLQAAIMTYDKNGTKKIVIPTTSYTVPSTALSVELTGTNVSSVTANSKPNCLYIIDNNKTVSGLDGKNVITYDGDSYSAANISLTDGSDFYSPVDFTAANIEYTYDYEGKAGGTGKAADGTNGWSTIMLPYDVTKVTATSNENVTKEIDWFHSETDGGGQFWLKKFTDDSVGTVNFNFVEENGMKAYTPYIIALPGNRWGTSHQLNDKTIKFIGTNVIVYNGSTLSTITGSNYRFIGKTVTDGTENIYCLNDDGNQFELNTSGGSKPFRAYFKADTFDRTMTSLAIGSGSGTTDIQTFEPTSKPQTDSWYTLDGRRISGQPTQKGLYIVNGKKTVIK